MKEKQSRRGEAQGGGERQQPNKTEKEKKNILAVAGEERPGEEEEVESKGEDRYRS